MNTRAVEVIGTFQGFWTHWAKQMLAQAGDVELHSDPRSWQDLDAIVRARHDTHLLVLVEHPAIGLAQALVSDPDIDPESWLDTWMSSARTLLAHAQRNPDTVLLVDADEAWRRPQRLARALRSRWNEPFTVPSRLAPEYAGSDPLARALAWRFVECDPAVQDVVSESMASCVPLPGLRAGTSQPMPDGDSDGVEAASRLAALLQAERRLAQVESDRQADRDQHRAAMQAAADESARLASAVEALQARHDGMKARADASDRALTDVRSTLDAVIRERDSLVSGLETAESRMESIDCELTQARQESVALGCLLDETHAALALAREGRSDIEGALSLARERNATLERDLAGAERQRAALETALGQARARQAELEQELGRALEQRDLDVQALARTSERKSELERDLLEAAEQRNTIEQALTVASERGRVLERDLAAATKQRSAFEQELAEANKQSGSLERSLADAKTKSEVLERELAEAKKATRAATEHGDLLHKQLHQVQEELERMFLAKSEAETALRAATAGPDPKKLEQELRSSREECELLTLQTHQVQQELEHLHAEKVRLVQEAKSRIALPGFDDVAIGEITLISARDTPPHREVSFVVRDVRAGERRIPEATVRLVEHWGRPGLVIFAGDGHAPLLEVWRESGEEGGRPYMLLVHGEGPAQSAYDAMGSLDWRLVQALAIGIGQTLREHAEEHSAIWPSLAERLLTSLREQPARLRYDNVVVTSIADAHDEHPRFGLTLERVSYHGRIWQRLPIQWQPNGPTRSLELVCDEASGPPLLAWPADADGLPVRALRLPLADDPDTQENRAVWDKLTGSDRALVADLLNLMPILAVHLQAAVASAGNAGRQHDLQADATTAMLLGRAALQPPGAKGNPPDPGRPDDSIDVSQGAVPARVTATAASAVTESGR